MGLFNRLGGERRIPMSWQPLLSWGSLRGALAATMALLIPDEATIVGWQYDFTVKEFITALTIGCIYFTLLIKATTINRVMKKLGTGNLHAHEEMLRVYAIGIERHFLRILFRYGEVTERIFKRIQDELLV